MQDDSYSATRQSGLIVFARFPRLNEVKTRLQPALGAEGCLELYEAMLLDSLDRYQCIQSSRFLFLAGCDQAEGVAFLKANSLEAGFVLRRQSNGDLGERMWAAYLQVSQTARYVLFLGTDTPSIPLAQVRRALAALKGNDAVIGPASDGGYCLLGVSKPLPRLFHEIPWGSGRVLDLTLSRMGSQKYELLAPWYDIDQAEDLSKLAVDLKSDFEGYPKRTNKFLRSQGLLA